MFKNIYGKGEPQSQAPLVSPYESESHGHHAVIFLHGWGACKEMWRLVFRSPLSDRYRLIALDLPGTGGSEIGLAFTTVALADWVAEEVAKLGIERFSIVGHSMGGNVAVHLAHRYPNSVASLTLVDAALFSDRMVLANWYLIPIAGQAILSGARNLAGIAGWVESKLAPVDSPGWGRGYARRSGYLKFNNSLPGLQAQLAGLLSSPADIATLPRDLPVLMIHGAKDSTVPVGWAHEAASLRPHNLRLIVYQDALHCPMDTHTSDFVHDLTEFLDAATAHEHHANDSALVSPSSSADDATANSPAI